MSKPLAGIRIVEMAGIGPGPHASMMLSDLGAEVVRVVRPTAPEAEYTMTTHTLRGRTTVLADLKDPDALEGVRQLLDSADVVVEGFRPGVMERLGVGPEESLARNPRLVFARMTGWGQEGPLAEAAGHDINYISLTGALHAIGPADHPVPPANLVGDFGGGSMFLVVGVLAALFERERTGRGQVVDAAMVDGAGVLVQSLLELRRIGMWTDERQSNLLDGAAPFYRTYRCSDGRFMAVGAIEPQFYALLLEGLELDPAGLPDQNDQSRWEEVAEVFAEVFERHPREYWTKVFEGTDACVSPVLTFEEAPDHPHVAARGSLVRRDGSVVAATAPRLSAAGATPTPDGGVQELAAVADAWSR
ncbi:CaiB/BaiF CoA transferase family protein [Nocardioides campestrisoli]|uniref:CaiB/BaiF CoA transferase family protein n=1 Tax=Nocardioides campestrisoli TaxID=2736757 RepID=UPI00163DDC3E|nr:CaiB/BaiF CoA-transferase family protein [Nocardioides campestrisoli]